MKTTAVNSTPPSAKGELPTNGRSVFLSLATSMSWQLTLVVLLPMISGALLDKKLDSSPAFVLVGLALAVVGSIAVMWRTMQVANTFPVPKLTAAEKRKIQKQYEEDDADD